MLPSKSELRNKKLREIDTYIQNIEVIVALSNILSFFGAKNVIGKGLKDKNRPDSEPVRPDLTSEFPNNIESKGYAIISESKTSFPREKEYRKKEVDQLKSYDAEFDNWDTDIRNHDIILVTDVMLAPQFWGYLQELAEKDEKYHFKHNLVVFSYTRDTKTNHTFLVIRKEFGDLSNSIVEKKLKLNRIPLKNFFREVEATKFYDHKPDTIYVMEILWDFIFSKGKSEEDYKNYPMNKSIPITVKTDELWKTVKERFSPKTNPDVVRRAWIKEALDKFVELKLAEQLDKDGSEYKIFFRKRGKRKSTRNFLLDMIYGEDEVVPEGQTSLDAYPKT